MRDDGGVNCAREFWQKVRHDVFMREIELERVEQPDALAHHRIEHLLKGSSPFSCLNKASASS